MQLLVVEQERMLAEALASYLDAQDDIEVVGTVHSVDDAEKLAIDLCPQVVTTGYRLPDGNGVDLLARLRARLGDVKVILVTGVEARAIVDVAWNAGFAGFVSKSAPPSDVAAAARSAMAGQVSLPPALFSQILSDLGDKPRRRGSDLSAVELQILLLFPEGLSAHAIGERLGMSERSVRNHIESILTKLESHSKLQGLATAIRRGIIFLVVGQASHLLPT